MWSFTTAWKGEKRYVYVLMSVHSKRTSMYSMSTMCPQVMCFRGTNQLEGWHQHYKRGFGYNHASAPLAKALLMDMAHNWTLKMGITHRGDPDFGTFEHYRLEKVCDLVN